jgi:membrane associated rhomboid family serine protease
VGIENRDYMEDGGGPGLSGSWAVMSVSHKLIVANVVVFLAWMLLPQAVMRDQFLVSWAGVFEQGRVWTLLTAAFSHNGLWHLLWNMLFLHWFGPDLEQLYGRRNFLVLYLYAALVGSLGHVVYQHGWGYDVPMLGASGAVMAVVVVAAMFSPQRTILFMFVIPVPLWALASLKLLGDLAGIAGPGDGVSHAAHLGGAVAGVAYKLLDLRVFASPGERTSGGLRLPWQRGRKPARTRARVRQSVAVDAGPAAPASRVDTATAGRVDDLLRKINQSGMDSLSEEELGFLREASARYKRPGM